MMVVKSVLYGSPPVGWFVRARMDGLRRRVSPTRRSADRDWLSEQDPAGSEVRLAPVGSTEAPEKSFRGSMPLCTLVALVW